MTEDGRHKIEEIGDRIQKIENRKQDRGNGRNESFVCSVAFEMVI